MKTLALAAAFSAALAGAAAAEFPERAITWVVPFGAGGVTDITSRRLAERLGAVLGQPVIVENKPGAGGIVGSKEVQMAKPDGYTVLFASSGPFGIQAALDPGKLKYDPLADFAYIHGVTLSPQIITANSNAPFNTIAELVAYAKENPGKLNYGSPGVGTAQHLGGELFERAAGIEMEHIPYTSGSTQMVDLASGIIDLSFEYHAIVTPYIADGKMKALGATSPERTTANPDLQTVVEAGFPTAVNLGWTYLVVPKDVPADVQQKLTEAMAEVMKDPEIVKLIEADGRSVLDIQGDEAGRAFATDQIAKFKTAADGIALK